MSKQNEKYQSLKSKQGITLIALIITIIVLLILAVVSIKLIWDGGIITHAKLAVKKYNEEQKKEQELLNTSFGEKENVPDELKKYLLGKSLIDVINPENMIFLDDPNSIIDASTSVNFLGEIDEGMTDNDICIYLKYKNAAYKVICANEEKNYENKSISLIYTPDAEGKEGTTVKYSYDGTKEHEEEWTVLYNNGDNLEIVSPKTMGSLNLGYNDEQTQGDTDLEKAIYSYNNVVTRINKYCSDLVTNSNKIAVRSIGSNPNNPNEDNSPMYTSENLQKWNADYDGRGKVGDRNFEQDAVRMLYWGVNKTLDEKRYFLNSRLVHDNNDATYFLMMRALSDGTLHDNYAWIWNVKPTGSASASNSKQPVRPVVKIKS